MTAADSGMIDPRRCAVARIHVRRGDYVGNSWALDPDWYKRALDMVYEVSSGAIETEIVTNDPGWCTENLDLGRAFRVLPTGSPLEDIRTLASSDFLIISRSTFSWWAAAISDAVVIAPDPWFPSRSRDESADMLPSKWLLCAA